MTEFLASTTAAALLAYATGFLVVCGGVHAAQWMGVL